MKQINNQKSMTTFLKCCLYAAFLAVACVACSSDDDSNTQGIEVTGILQVQGITNYQYGTHVIAEYAIRSSTINLDDFVNQSVTVVGTKIDGYPVDGGPDYLEVTTVK